MNTPQEPTASICRQSGRRIAALAASVLIACSANMPAAEELKFPHLPPEAIPPSRVVSLENTPLEDWKNYPVVDIHTHTFNALYLPVSNIASGRIREYPLGGMMDDLLLHPLVNALVGATHKNQAGPGGQLDGNARFAIANRLAPNGTLRLTAADVDVGAALRGQRASPPTVTAPKRSDEATKQLEELINKPEVQAGFTELLTGAMSHGDKSAGTMRLEGGSDTGRRFGPFLAHLISGDALIRRALRTSFAYAPGDPKPLPTPRVALFVHHTMDMGKTYGQEPGDDFWSFERKVLPQVRSLDLHEASGNQFIHFVAFNPFNATAEEREKANWRQSTAIQIVERALKAGAWGVKYYPPAGYRPSHNDRPGKPFFVDHVVRDQWDSRYAKFPNEKLDALNLAFFEFCADNDVPVFAHCNTGEFQAAKDYGVNMASPVYYRAILEYLAQKGKRLRLCLGHAGGPDFWFGDDTAEHADWGQQVYELCTRFPDVYCEVGILSEVIDPELRARFSARLGAYLNQPVPTGRYDFGKKILYGSDWFMPEASDAGPRFLNACQAAVLNAGLQNPTDRYKDFFCRNALRFLDVTGRLSTIPHPICPPLATGLVTTLQTLQAASK